MIKVFVIDDSVLVRNFFRKLLALDKELKLIGEAENPIDAFNEFKKVGLPDVFILDINMPKMNGLEFLKQIQSQKPIPTIICSTLVTKDSKEFFEATKLGATDIILKPKFSINEDEKKELLERIKSAALAKNLNIKTKEHKIITKKASNKIIAIGASTGGVQTIEAIVTKIKPNHAPIIITQHIPAGFSKSFAERLNNLVESYVKEAKEEDRLLPGQILIAPGDKHMKVFRKNGNLKVTFDDGEKVNGHKPSVDVMFFSVAKVVKQDAIGILLTGMGNDGAKGLLAMKQAGAKTYAQDEKTSIVYGMPKVAKDIGAVDKVLSIDEIIDLINGV